ncbi:hypothetical protein HF668_03395 [Acidithiobacillus ferridurans]|uniref:IS66 family insertion sequence element accessory protein TnpA n=1 Tax=Acidithiobacillus ferridurans TaxID=1232575 RepID=UPI001C070013|nr:hypothetical protein [Acidithiobacillus ferridurans]MBU2804214.1 hypothetical protein [Acidithiobacillus ferridurans]
MDHKRESGALERADVWQQRVLAQEASALSVRQFCAQQGWSLPQFYYWRRRLRENVSGPGATDSTDLSSAFVELGLTGLCPPKAPVAPLEIRLDLGGGCVLSIRRG